MYVYFAIINSEFIATVTTRTLATVQIINIKSAKILLIYFHESVTQDSYKDECKNVQEITGQNSIIYVCNMYMYVCVDLKCTTV